MLRLARMLVILVLAAAAAWAATDETCALVPFENRSGDPNLNWIGESFVVALTEAMGGTEVTVLNRAEWARALALAGAPAGEDLSHATLIRIAEGADARWLVVGWFNYDGEQLQAEASVIDLQQEHLATLAPVTGTLQDLETMQEQLGWGLRQQLAPGTGKARAAAALPLVAYENYVRSLMATNPVTRLMDLKVAAHFAPSDPRIQLQLGEAYMESGDNPSAYRTLTAIKAEADQYVKAQFEAGLAAFKMQDYPQAAASFGVVAQRLPLPAVQADLALAKAQMLAGTGSAPTADLDAKLQTDFPADDYRQLMTAVAQFDSKKAGLMPPGQQITFALEEGRRLQQQGGLEAAETQYRAVLRLAAQISPPSPETEHQAAAAHVGLAQVWLARHEMEQAAAEIKAALQADPGNLAAQALERQLEGKGGHA